MNEHAQGIRARPTGFGLLLAAVCVLAAVGGARSADPQVAGLAWVVLGAVVLVGAIWPICAVAAVQVRVLACDVDATVGGEVGLDVALIGWSSSLELRLAGSTDDGWHRVGAPGSGRLPCPAVARGRYEQLVVEVASSAPLGVLRARRRVALTLPSPLFVGPTAVDVEWHPDLIERGSVDGTSSLASLSGDVVRSVRPYAPGDPSHLVHWPSSARAGALMVRELEPPSEVGVAVIVEIGDHAGRAEEVASHAAGMVLAVTSAGGRLVLCTHDAGGARSDVVVTLTHAMRLLAAATPGAPGSPPSGWPIAAVHP